ncbi:MAG: DUF116 domain-containing protein [Deltaproteobacteria bacterium]|jgi:hypothetical protein|nr:DUF116 domain-containing protein [Deltaproteobacteria bacterium]
MSGKIGSKRLFVGLICGASMLICLALIFGWGIPYIGFGNIHPALPYITGSLLALSVLVLSWGAFALVLHILTGWSVFGADRSRGLAVKLFLPVSEVLGRLLGISPQDVRRSFIQVNNEMVLKQRRSYAPEKILVLLPHCIQNGLCPIRVSMDLKSCKRCGRCDIGQLLNLVERYGARIAIATGGTIARRIVVDARPEMILAVACERDLSSGIQDSYPLPVYGIPNERPCGPCRDTRVSLPLVEESLKRFIRPDQLPPPAPSAGSPEVVTL